MLTEGPTHAAAAAAKEKGLDPLTYEAHQILVRAVTALTGSIRRNNPSRFSLGRYNVLRLLYAAEEKRLLMSEIGDGLEISPTIVTRLVDSLVVEGIVERITHPEDKRKTWAAMTGEGIAIFEGEMPLMAEQIEKLWRGLQPEEKRLLVHLLSKLRLSLLTISPDELKGAAQGAL